MATGDIGMTINRVEDAPLKVDPPKLPELEEQIPIRKPGPVAYIDNEGIFQEMRIVHPDDYNANHLSHIKACDLPAGKYRWVESKRAFEFVDNRKGIIPKGMLESEPCAQKALIAFFKACQTQNIILPPETVKWMNWWKQSFDNKE